VSDTAPVHLVLHDRDVVGVRRADVGRADHADGPDRHKDVAVARHRAAVDHRVHEPVVHGDHDPLAGYDADTLDPRHVSDLRRPCARGVDREPRLDVELLPGELVAHARTRDGIVLPMQVDHAVIGQNPRPVHGRPAGERPDGLPCVDRRVGDGKRAPAGRVQPRLAAQRLGYVDLLGGHAARPAAGEELVCVCGIVVGRRHEEPAGVLDAVGDHAAQDRVLRDALLGGHRVLHDIAAPRVQQAVEAATRPLGKVGPVDEHDVEPPQRCVPGDPGAGGAAADHQQLGLEAWHRANASC
jgi:hypothetical protein